VSTDSQTTPQDALPAATSRGEKGVANHNRPWVWIGFVALLVLHQDLWLWAEADLWLGPLPAGLAYHAGYSLVVALFWLAVVRFAWPSSLDDEETT